jgi:hypothetical protein
MAMSPASVAQSAMSGSRLPPYLSGLPGQPSAMETMQPAQAANTMTSPAAMNAPYGMIAPSARTAALHNNLATLAETIAQATSLIQAAGLGQGFHYLPSHSKSHPPIGRIAVVMRICNHCLFWGPTGALSTHTAPGIQMSPGQPPANNNYPAGETYDPSYCSVKLPTPQPLAPMDSHVAER